jgi:hypothetical protein
MCFLGLLWIELDKQWTRTDPASVMEYGRIESIALRRFGSRTLGHAP